MTMDNDEIKRSLTTKQVINHFKKLGTELSKEEAERYLNLLYFLAKQVVDQNLRKSTTLKQK